MDIETLAECAVFVSDKELELEIESSSTFTNFIKPFKLKNGKYPKTINKLIKLHIEYPTHIYAIYEDNVFILCIKRPALIKVFEKIHRDYDYALTIIQNFERCLMLVKPKLKVLQSTHGHFTKYYCLLSDYIH